GGGPPAGQQPVGNEKDPKAHAQGTGGTPFLPVHAEVRGQFWFLPLTAKLLRAYALLGGGMAQVDAKVTINEYDCEDAGKNANGTALDKEPWGAVDPATGQFVAQPDGTGISPYNQCRSGKKSFYSPSHHGAGIPVDGWKKMGQGFIEAGV